jgi:deoxycytidine triphosphate deaminase
MALMTDAEIRQAVESGEISIEPFDATVSLQPASYDLKVGDTAIVAKSVKLEELETRLKEEVAPEIDLKQRRTISVPAGGFALVTTLERVSLSKSFAAHIGIRSYYTRKGLALLSGLQIDPGFSGYLVLGLANLSPRSIGIDYADPLCTIEIHRLASPAEKAYDGKYALEQREPRIPAADKDYLRTIETMSVSDITQALLTLSRNVQNVGEQLNRLWYMFIATFGAAVLAAIFSIVFR